MAIVVGTIQGTGQTVNIEIPVVRIPELQPFDDLQDLDLLAGFDVSENKTRYMTLAMLRSKIIGDGTTQPPILTAGTIQLVVDSTHAGTLRWDLPAIAGKDFKLERRALGSLIVPEYDIISTGGFLLKGTSAVMQEGEIFIITLTELQGGDVGVIENSGGLFTGIVTIDNSTAYGSLHKRKVINIAGGDNHVTYTLPEVDDVEENAIIPFETHGANTYQTAITTAGGQLIYMNGSAYSTVYMGFGEILWLQAGTDGWYVVAMHGNFLTVGEPQFGYKKQRNSLELNGQLVARADMPRLFQEISGYGSMIVSEDLWTSAVDYQGFFTLGPTTGPNANKFFRLPKVGGTFIRFTGDDRGLDPDQGDRIIGGAGSYQGDEFKKHKHTTPAPRNSGGTANFLGGGSFEPGPVPVDSSEVGGNESRSKNIYFNGYIKA